MSGPLFGIDARGVLPLWVDGAVLPNGYNATETLRGRPLNIEAALIGTSSRDGLVPFLRGSYLEQLPGQPDTSSLKPALLVKPLPPNSTAETADYHRKLTAWWESAPYSMPREAVDRVAAEYGVEDGLYGAMRSFTKADSDYNLGCPTVQWATVASSRARPFPSHAHTPQHHSTT